MVDSFLGIMMLTIIVVLFLGFIVLGIAALCYAGVYIIDPGEFSLPDFLYDIPLPVRIFFGVPVVVILFSAVMFMILSVSVIFR